STECCCTATSLRRRPEGRRGKRRPATRSEAVSFLPQLRRAAGSGGRGRASLSHAPFLSSSPLLLAEDVVVEPNDAVRKAARRSELQPHAAVTWRDQRDSFPDEDRNDVDDESIDLSFVQEGGDDFAASHHPDVLARLGAQPFGEVSDRLSNELGAPRTGFRRPAREHIVFDARADSQILAGHLESHFVVLPSPQDRIDRAEERSHPVVSLRPRPIEPLDASILAGDVPVGRGRDVNDDLPPSFHCGSSSCSPSPGGRGSGGGRLLRRDESHHRVPSQPPTPPPPP